MKHIIKEIILENQNSALPSLIKRNITIELNLKMIVSLVGARRSGKTYILYDLISQLKHKGISKENILFLNFEDERLNLTTNDLDLIIQAYTELFPAIELNTVYFFFDEIQNVDDWEKFVRRIFDTKSRNIFITGSNSKLLSTEIATALRGRTITYEIYPLSFSEYLLFNNVKQDLYPQKNKSTIIHYFEKFLTNGGFPEIVFFDDRIRIKILQQYYNVMIFRDIVERYQVSNIDALRFLIKKMFASVTKPFSVNKTYNDLKSLGYKISNKYLYSYFTYCNDSYLSQSVNKFDFSEIRQAKSEKKTYIIDTGLLSAIEFSISKNKGKLLENLVFLEFLKSNKDIYYFKHNYECDFIIHSNGDYLPVQVSYDIHNTKTKERELNGLIEACQYLKSDKGLIITFDQEENIKHNSIDIDVIPAYKYFLTKEKK
ncbi:MAG: ATP-binding protein [Bacteroidales bacterium]|nr:ATP-binding protein [Bacteroidales bacterium]